MRIASISEIYANNKKVRDRLLSVVSALSDEDAKLTSTTGGWTIAQVIEHISMVERGAASICVRLLKKARDQGLTAGDDLEPSAEFVQRTAEIANVRVEAPEIVRPSEGATISNSLRSLKESSLLFDEIRPLFEKYNACTQKFPHPFLGELTAVEWLMMAGGHEARHLKQIENILEQKSIPAARRA
jgi:hypothetical protein